MRVYDDLPGPLSDKVVRAAEWIETEEELEVVFVGSAKNAVRARAEHPRAVLFRLWQAPADYAGNRAYVSIGRPGHKSGVLKDCYQKVGGAPDPHAHIAWDGPPVGTVRCREVYDFVGLYRVKSWDDRTLYEVVQDPIRRAVAMPQDESRDAFVRGLTARLHTTMDAERARLADLRSKVEVRRSSLSTAVRAVVEAEASLHGLERREEDQTRALAAEFDMLAAHPRVANLDVSSGKLVITTTDDFRLWDGAESRWLGAFTISIDVAAGGDIRIRNLNTRRNGSDHPHIHDGQVCWGEYAVQITELTARGELLTVFEMVAQFLETYNRSDQYAKYAAWWLNAPDERPLTAA